MKIPSSIAEYLTECEIRKYTPIQADGRIKQGN